MAVVRKYARFMEHEKKILIKKMQEGYSTVQIAKLLHRPVSTIWFNTNKLNIKPHKLTEGDCIKSAKQHKLRYGKEFIDKIKDVCIPSHMIAKEYNLSRERIRQIRVGFGIIRGKVRTLIPKHM